MGESSVGERVWEIECQGASVGERAGQDVSKDVAYPQFGSLP